LRKYPIKKDGGDSKHDGGNSKHDKMKNSVKNIIDENNNYRYQSNENYINHLKPAYMISCHKSQGQEANNILIFSYARSPARILNKNLLYTAVLA